MVEGGGRAPGRVVRPDTSCSIGVWDPPRKFGTGLVNHKEQRWATNNVDKASRAFQNGVEMWIRERLAQQPNRSTGSEGPSRTFAAIYWSFIHIFARDRHEAAGRVMREFAQRHARRDPGGHIFVPHSHPGSCHPSTSRMVRLLVDKGMSCGDSPHSIPVPYVVSQPKWLVWPTLPASDRTTLVFFRGHIPKGYIDKRQVRATLVRKLAGIPSVVVEPATLLGNASYQRHGTYLHRMLSSVFCLAPRGDTASGRRLYEAIAAGCIPVIIADELELPFQSQLDWPSFSLRYSEDLAVRSPLKIIADLRAMHQPRVRRMPRALLEARPSLLWHTDPGRVGAVDRVIHEMCAWGAPTKPKGPRPPLPRLIG